MTWLSTVIFFASLASLAYVLFLKTRGRATFGLALRPAPLAELGAGLLVAAVPVALAWALLLATNQIAITNVAFDAKAAGNAALELLLFAGLEEFLFRVGMLLALLHLTRNAWLAVGVQMVLFALAHAGNPNANALTVVSNAIGGLMYAGAFLATGRVWMPLAVHFAWNFTQGLLGFAISGSLGYSRFLVHLNALGPDWLSGGGYGLEGSVIGILARFFVLAGTYYVTQRWAQRPAFVRQRNALWAV